MWQLEISQKKDYSCFHYGLMVLAHFYNRNYQMSFLELLGFKYNQTSNCIGKNLQLFWLNKEERRKELLLKYHGLKFEIFNLNSNETIEYIDQHLQYSPIIVYIDSYNCNWLPFYQKQHCDHAIVILGENEKTYQYIDQYQEYNKVGMMPKSFILNETIKLIQINATESFPVLANESYVDEIQKSVNSYLQNNAKAQYLCFLKDVKTQFNIECEICRENPIASPLIMQLKFIGEDRKNLVEAFKFIQTKTKISFMEVNDKFIKIAKIYENIRAYLLKCTFSMRKPDNEKIYDELQTAFCLEQNCICNLQTIV